MTSPFAIVGPTAISFSGGRTSALMLRRVLDAHGGTLPPDARVVFANTGKERPETLDFVEEVSQRWNVPITWVEYRRGPSRAEWTHAIVNHATASRNGEPFAALIASHKYLPNPFHRFCTEFLKVRPIKAALGWSEWTSFIGVRADEPKRWHIRGEDTRSPGETREIPLADAGVTKAEVLAFWASQPFDLRLRGWEGNCDICFLKGRAIAERIIRDRPDAAQWWSDREAEIGGRFVSDRPHYARLAANVASSPLLPMALDPPDDEGTRIDCLCSEAA